jgi:hypothetical protein
LRGDEQVTVYLEDTFLQMCLPKLGCFKRDDRPSCAKDAGEAEFSALAKFLDWAVAGVDEHVQCDFTVFMQRAVERRLFAKATV